MNLTVGVSTTSVPYSGASDPPPSTDPHNVTTAETADPAVRITLSPEAVAAMSQSAGDPVTTLPDVLVQATRRDQQTWVNQRSFKPWTPETQRQFDQYVSGTLARANQAFDLVQSAISTEGLDLNNPDHKEVYEKAVDSLMVTAYRALENGDAFVDGPGTQDMKARDFITMLRNTDIVFKGGSHAFAAEFDPASGRLEIYPSELITRTAAFPRDVAINSVLFHEIGHAVGAGRLDASQTWDNYRAHNPSLSGLALETAYASSTQRTELEARATARGWGFSEIARLSFNPNIDLAGSAPR